MRSAHGFTLIELTIAIVLLAIGLLALTGALASSLRVTSDARVLHAALREAEAVADSVVTSGSIAGGSRATRNASIRWHPFACGPAACVRVTAQTARDTLTIVAAEIAH